MVNFSNSSSNKKVKVDSKKLPTKKQRISSSLDDDDEAKSISNDSKKSNISESSISLGVSTLKRLFPSVKSAHLEKVLYSTNGDLVLASQKLSQQQHNQQQQSNSTFNEMTSNSTNNHLLSLANQIPPIMNKTANPASFSPNLFGTQQDNMSLKSYQSALLSSLNNSNEFPNYSHFNTGASSPNSTHSSSSAFTPMLLKTPNQHMQEQALAAMKFNLPPFSTTHSHSRMNSSFASNGISDIYNAMQQFSYFPFGAAAHQLVSAVSNNKPKLNSNESTDNLGHSLSLDSNSSPSSNNLTNSTSSSSNSSSPSSVKVKSINNSPNSLVGSSSPPQTYTLASLSSDSNYNKSLSLTY